MPDNYFDFSSLKTTRNRPYDADNLNYIYGRLKERGYDDKHIAVLLGTIAEESGGNPYAVSPDGKFQGLLQWAGDRYAINPFMEENPKRELDRQIDYIARTIDNLDDSKSWTHGGKGSGYNRAADAHEAYVSSDSLDAINHAFNRGYVRPTGGDDSVANRYKVAEQVYNIITSGLPESVKAVNNSDAPFARDLRAGAKQRGYIKNADGSVSSYKMASGADDIGPYVFPVIQRDENGVLRDYSMPPYKAGYAQQRAEETGNLVRVPTDADAQWFAEDNYKRFYDVAPDINAYAKGGGIHIKPENRGKFTALKERTGHSATWFKENGTPAQRKMATFALNSKKWGHRHDDGGELDDISYGGIIQPSVKMAYAPSINTQEGKNAAKVMAEQIAAGQYSLQNVPRSYYNYVQGELNGATPVRNAINKAGEKISPFVGSLAAGPIGGIAYLAGEGINAGVNVATNGNGDSWGDLFVDENKHPILNTLADATNPAYATIGLLETPQLVSKAIDSNRNLQKAVRLYNYGKNPRVLTSEGANLVNEYSYPARRAATQKQNFTKAERVALSDRIKSSERENVKRLFGESYDEVFDKHATSPLLKKIFRENPEYLYFVEQTGYDPMSQSTIDAFAKRQASSVRGVHLDKATNTNIRNAIEQYKVTGNAGGDRFGTNGGVYSSNSQGLADIFQRGHGTNVDVDNVIAKIQYPYSRTNGSIRTQLKNIRNDVVAVDDWRNATDLLFSSPDLKDYRFVEGPYAKRSGEIFDVYERATTKPMKVQSFNAKVAHGLPDMMGRWGRSEVAFVPGDEELFIPKVTTRNDISKIISGGKNKFNRDIYDAFMKNVYEQNAKRMNLIEGSVPYRVGKHVYDHTNIIGGKDVYMPLVGAGVSTGIVGGSAIGLKAFHDKKKETIENEQKFMASPYYRKYLEEREGLDRGQMMDLRKIYYEKFMKDSK